MYISLDFFQVSHLWIYHQRRRKKQLLAHPQLIQPWIYSRLSTHLWPQAQSLQRGPLKNHLILPLAILKAERSIPRRSWVGAVGSTQWMTAAPTNLKKWNLFTWTQRHLLFVNLMAWRWSSSFHQKRKVVQQMMIPYPTLQHQQLQRNLQRSQLEMNKAHSCWGTICRASWSHPGKSTKHLRTHIHLLRVLVLTPPFIQRAMEVSMRFQVWRHRQNLVLLLEESWRLES